MDAPETAVYIYLWPQDPSAVYVGVSFDPVGELDGRLRRLPGGSLGEVLALCGEPECHVIGWYTDRREAEAAEAALIEEFMADDSKYVLNRRAKSWPLTFHDRVRMAARARAMEKLDLVETTDENVEAWDDRASKALRLRAQGLSLSQVAQVLGIGGKNATQVAHNLVRRALVRQEQSSSDLQALELHRLDMILHILWEPVQERSPKAIALVLELIKLRTFLLGGRQAPAVQVNVNVDATALRNRRWAEIKDTPVGLLLASSDAFADPDTVEGEYHERGDPAGFGGTGQGTDEVGPADRGADQGDQRADGADGGGQPGQGGGAGTTPGAGAADGNGTTVRRPRFPHLHEGLAAAARGNRPRGEE